jgi:GT2 family glycosyltransferase
MDSGDKVVGVVTVTYNSACVIDDFMKSILKQTYLDFILYIVDNASSDDTLRRLAEYGDGRIVPIPNEVNAGVAEGNNIGIRAALKDGCGFVLLINNDTVFEPNLISKLAAGLQEHKCDMVVPKILFFDNPEKIWCAGGYFNAFRGVGSHFGLGRKDDGQFDLARAVGYSPTCCMLIRGEVFDRVGLMDSSYFLYFDDTDFCLRAHRAGVQLFYLPSARLRHKVSSLTGGTSEFTIRYITRNHVYYLLKHYSRWRTFLYCLVFYIYIFGKYLILSRRPKLFWAAQKAFWEGISLFMSNLGRAKPALEPTGVP